MQRLGTENSYGVREVARRSSLSRLRRLSARLRPARRGAKTPPPSDPLPSSCRRARGAVRHRVAPMAHFIHAPPDRLTAATAVCTRAHTLITYPTYIRGVVMSIDTRYMCAYVSTIPGYNGLQCHTWPLGAYDDEGNFVAAFSSLSSSFSPFSYTCLCTRGNISAREARTGDIQTSRLNSECTPSQ